MNENEFIDKDIESNKNCLEDPEKSNQEKYIACLKLGELYNKYSNAEKEIYYLIESHQYDKTRLEGIYQLVKHYCCSNKSEIAFSFYTLIQNFYENQYLSCCQEKFTEWLHVNQEDGDFYLPYYMIIVCERLRKYEIGLKMYEIIFRRKKTKINTWMINCLIYNLQFFIDKVNSPDFFNLCENYINFLVLNYSKDFIHNEILYKIIHVYLNKDNILFKNDILKINPKIVSNKILIYCGYNYFNWNTSYGKNNFLGGSERAIVFLTQQLPKNMEIYVVGSVLEEKIDNVQYIHVFNAKNFIENNQFHAIIISRYIGFFEMFFKFQTKRIILWGHDINLLPYNSENKLTDIEIISRWNNLVNNCVCLTEWHKDRFQNKYAELKDKIQIIGNGIPLELFPENVQNNTNKQTIVKNRFVYSSNPSRGLTRILELWPEICKILPGAELKVIGAEPDDSQKKEIKFLQELFSNIEHLGACSPEKLYKIMSTCDIWFYPVTNFEETFCITALEVLYCNVIAIYYPVAGLKDTVGDYGIAVERGKEMETLKNLTEEKKTEMRDRGRKYAEECSWKNRMPKWNDILDLDP